MDSQIEWRQEANERADKADAIQDRIDQIDKLLFHDARALGYHDFDELLNNLNNNQPIPADFADHIDALMHEEMELYEKFDQIGLPDNVIVFPLSKRAKYDKLVPFYSGSPFNSGDNTA